MARDRDEDVVYAKEYKRGKKLNYSPFNSADSFIATPDADEGVVYPIKAYAEED